MLVTNYLMHDNFTFDEATPIQNWSCWHEFRQQAMFNVEFYISIDRHDMATRYYNLVNRIENRMRKMEVV